MTKPSFNLALEQKVQGIIEITKLDAVGNVIQHIPKFNNLLVNSGLDQLCSAAAGFGSFTYCKVGTGAGTPAVSDTTLPGGVANQVKTNTVVTVQNTSAPYYKEYVQTFLFPLGAINATLSCVGLGTSNNNTEIKCWSQIKDSGNNPTTITVLATEQLQVSYTLRVYAPTFTSTPSIVIAGDATYSATMYAQQFNSGNFWVSSAIASPFASSMDVQNWTTVTPPANITTVATYTGLLSNTVSSALAAYTNGTYYRDVTYSLATTDGNLAGGIKGITVYGTGQPNYFINFNGAIPKNNTKTLSFNIRYSVARYP